MESGFSIEMMGQRVKARYLLDDAPRICQAMSSVLPVDGQAIHAKFAGKEIIVMVPFLAEPENEILEVEAGDVGYYPGRQTICIFYGETVPFGKVSVFARIDNNMKALRKIGAHILKTGVVNMRLTGI